MKNKLIYILFISLLFMQDEIASGLHSNNLISYLQNNYTTNSTLGYDNGRDILYREIEAYQNNGEVKGICDSTGVNNSPWKQWQYFTTPSGIRSNGGNQELTNKFYIFPNPTRGIFNISFFSETLIDFNITVVDAFGKIIVKENEYLFIGEFTKQIDLSEYPKGIYVIKIQTGDSFVSRRLVLQ